MASEKLYNAYKNAFGVDKKSLTDDQLAAAVAASRSGSFKDRLRAQGYGDTLDRGAKLSKNLDQVQSGKYMDTAKDSWGRKGMTGEEMRKQAAFLEELGKFGEAKPFTPQGQGEVTQNGSTKTGQYNNGADANVVRPSGSKYDAGADAVSNVANYNPTSDNYVPNGASVKDDNNTYNGKMRDASMDQADAEMLAKDNQTYGVDPEALAAAGTGLYAFGHNWNSIQPAYRAVGGSSPQLINAGGQVYTLAQGTPAIAGNSAKMLAQGTPAIAGNSAKMLAQGANNLPAVAKTGNGYRLLNAASGLPATVSNSVATIPEFVGRGMKYAGGLKTAEGNVINPAQLTAGVGASSGLFAPMFTVAAPIAATYGAGLYGADANIKRIQEELADDPYYVLE